MHKINALFLFFLLLFILGCEDKKSDTNTIPIENTTEVLYQKNPERDDSDRFKITKHEVSAKESSILTDTFTLSNMQNTTYTATVLNQKLTYKETQKAIVLITFFATWCTPCIHDIPYMNDLQKKYAKELLITGILVHDTISENTLRTFLAKHEVKYYVSNSMQNNDFASLVAKTLRLPKNFSIPLTVIYVEGEYFTHYEGIVPIEMIDYDIQQALKMLK